jgi:hypothetical protein
LHTLLNVLRFPAPGQPCAFSPDGLDKLDHVSELSYLTQVVIRLFESSQTPGLMRCELSFSPGATNDPFFNKSCTIAPYVLLNKSLPSELMLQALDNAIAAGGEASSLPLDTMSDAVDDRVDLAVTAATEGAAAAAGGSGSGGASNPSTPGLGTDSVHSAPTPTHHHHFHRSKHYAPRKHNTSVIVVNSDELEASDTWEHEAETNINISPKLNKSRKGGGKHH